MWYNNVNGDASINNSMATKTAKSSDDAKENNSTLGKYLKKFMDSWTYAQQNYHQVWEDNWKLYRNIRVKRNHPGTIEAFVPMVNSTVNTIVASLFNSNPTVKYIPNRADQDAETDILNDVYQDFARRDGWALKNKINGRQGVITGNYFAYYEWMPDENGGYVHKEIVPIRDAIIDPNAHNLGDAEYVGRRFFTSKKSLEEATIYNPETGKVEKRYKDLSDVEEGQGVGGVDSESDKAKKDEALGSVSPDRASQVEIIEIWTHKEVVVIANRKLVIEQRENPYYTLSKSRYEQRKLAHELERAQTLQESLGTKDIGPFDEEFVQFAVVQHHRGDAQLPGPAPDGLEGPGFGLLPVIEFPYEPDAGGIGGPFAQHPVLFSLVQTKIEMTIGKICQGFSSIFSQLFLLIQEILMSSVDGITVGL